MGFESGCAQLLYARRVHPRLLLGPRDLTALRRRVRSGQCSKVMAALRRKVAPMISRALATPDLRAALADPIADDRRAGKMLDVLHDMAFVAAVDRDADAAAAVARVLTAAAEVDAAGTIWKYLEGYDQTGSLAMAFDLVHPQLSSVDRARLIRYGLELGLRRSLNSVHDRFLQSAGQNTPIMKGVAGLTWLLAIEGEPGVPDLSAERDELVRFFAAAVHAAIGPEGYPAEDMGYGTMVVAKLAVVADMLRRRGLHDACRDCPRLTATGRAMLHFTVPWGAHQFNTGDRITAFPWREWFLGRLARETRDPALLWLLGRWRNSSLPPSNDLPDAEVILPGGHAVPASALSLLAIDPAQRPRRPRGPSMATHFCDTARGIVSFRSDWGDDATCVVFDGSRRSPAAPGHEHASCGHLSLVSLGEYFGVDAGRYGMDQADHSVVLVDGKSGRPTGGRWTASPHGGHLTAYAPGDFCDFASVDSSAQHDCFWARRSLVLVKGRGLLPYVWMIEDVNKANDFREYWWTLNTSPGNRIIFRGQGRGRRQSATIQGWQQGNLLDVHFALPRAEEYPRPHELELAADEAVTVAGQNEAATRALAARMGTSAPAVGRVPVRPRLVARVRGYNGRFMSVLLPRRRGEKPARVLPLGTLDNALALRIAFDGVEDTLIWAYEHHLLEADGIVARGNWCVVRRSARTGKVLDHAIADGNTLVVDGRPILRKARGR